MKEPAYQNNKLDFNWHPTGAHYWIFKECKVTRAVYANGEDVERDDRIFGMTLSNDNTKGSAKIRGFDPEMQYIAEIWGLRLQLGPEDHPDGLVGDLRPISVTDFWFRAPGSSSITEVTG